VLRIQLRRLSPPPPPPPPPPPRRSRAPSTRPTAARALTPPRPMCRSLRAPL
jgi:hypothetical protein